MRALVPSDGIFLVWRTRLVSFHFVSLELDHELELKLKIHRLKLVDEHHASLLDY